MVLYLHLRRTAPAVPVQQAEHVAETVHYQVHILVPVVGHAHNALARHVVGVVGFRTSLRVLQLARKVAVIKAHLAQRELGGVTVNVGHLLVHERREARQAVLHQHAVLRLVKVVRDRSLAQGLGLTVLVNIVVRIQQLAGLGVIDVKLASHKHVIHLQHARVVGLVRKARDGQYQPLGLEVHLAGALVAELAADQTPVALTLVLVHFLPKPQRALGQGVVELLPQHLDGLGHHAPVIFLAHQLTVVLGTVIKLDARVQNARVDDVLTCLILGQVNAGLIPVVEEDHRALVQLVVAVHPAH